MKFQNVVISGFTIQNEISEEPPYPSGIFIFRRDFAVINNNILRNITYGLQLTQSNNSRTFDNLIIDNLYPTAGDNYPLMGVFTNFTILHELQKYSLPTISNSTILNFQFSESQGKVSFDVFGPNGTAGFCGIALPTALIERKCVILLDDKAPFIRNWTVSTYCYRYFLYGNTGAAQKVAIEFELPRKGS